jgi:hypothetical protein
LLQPATGPTELTELAELPKDFVSLYRHFATYGDMTNLRNTALAKGIRNIGRIFGYSKLYDIIKGARLISAAFWNIAN